MEFLSKIFKSTFVKPRYDTENFLSVKHSVKIDFRTNTRPVSYFFRIKFGEAQYVVLNFHV